MDLVFDLDLSAPSESAPAETRAHQSANAAIAVARWYDLGYDAPQSQLGVTASLYLAATTAELLAYWWGTEDATQGRPRRDIL